MQPVRSTMFAHGSEFYEASDEDTGGDVQYFGYLNTSGKWIIQKIDRTTSVASIRYANGDGSQVAEQQSDSRGEGSKKVKAEIKPRITLEGRTRLETVIPLSTPYLVFLDPSDICNQHCAFCPSGDP